MRTKFKKLDVGQVFIFASEVDMPLSGMERGPWEKVSARKYRKRDSRFAGGFMVCTVGTSNVEVIL